MARPSGNPAKRSSGLRDDSVTGTNPILKIGKIHLTGYILTSISLRGFSRVQAFHLTAMDGFGNLELTLVAQSICSRPQ